MWIGSELRLASSILTSLHNFRSQDIIRSQLSHLIVLRGHDRDLVMISDVLGGHHKQAVMIAFVVRGHHIASIGMGIVVGGHHYIRPVVFR